jgi:hypothetical protein
MVLSALHTVTTRGNLCRAHERQQEKALWEEEYGLCRRCEDDSLDLPSCKDCINGGGKKKMFRSKTRNRGRKPNTLQAVWRQTGILPGMLPET